MQTLDMREIDLVSGGGALGTAIGMVLGALAGAAACAAATLPTGGAAAVGVIGVASATATIGGKIGSAIEDAL
ncbi:hypothetical protein [Undibacterium sp. TJN19]|uniref:hypothetical protein n=1 Tax=Undibacterium sp. TJN19 TaxID=3413055 RepID=UPI003BF2CBED